MNLLRNKVKVCAGIAISMIMVGCSSTNNQRTSSAQRTATSSQQVDEHQQLMQSPRYYLHQAEEIFRDTGDAYQRNQLILQAAEAFKQTGQCQQTNKVIALSYSQLNDSVLLNHAGVLKAECELLSDEVDYRKLAELLDSVDADISHYERIAKLQFELYLKQKNWLFAAKALTPLANDNIDTAHQIWDLLQNLSSRQLNQAALAHRQLAPWLQLSIVVKQFGLQPRELSDAVNQWQTRHSAHILNQQLPAEVLKALALKSVDKQRIAVLLPLSGRLTAQGQAIKEGVLAAYLASLDTTVDEQLQPEVHFYDTQQNDMADLAMTVSTYDWVIGPLLKDELAAFNQQSSKSVNAIGLNRLDDDSSTAALNSYSELEEQGQEPIANPVPEPEPGLRVYFALSPEDEAVQLAQKVFDTGVQYPIVVTQDSGAPMRMANAFLQTWQLLVGDEARAPSLATYVDNESMRTSLTNLLDVAQSNTRIDQIESLTSNQIHSVPRNRRDVDAIVLFATPEQTELLNPIVETSLSPFNDKAVPVFASSRSYSQNFSNNSLRDLRNITFTDMPWMLPGHEHGALQQEFETIWPQRDDTLKRLFALGYDAFDLLPDVASLAALGQVSKKGLTGSLSIDPNGNIVRVLPFGKITESEVVLIVED